MKTILLSVIFILSQNLLLGQHSNLSFSSGALFSDITSWDETITVGNNRKFGYYTSIGYQQKIWKFICLNGKAAFFNKKPLEVFAFGFFPEDGGLPGILIFSNVPTSRQSENFDEKYFNILSDFKYLGFDLVPSVSIGNKSKINFGIGLFYKRLINFEEVIVRRENLPSFDAFFEPPFYVSGEVSYGKNEWGWTSNIRFLIPINNKVSLGLDGNFYHSFRGMHDAPYSSVIGNPKWLIMTGGLNIQYAFEKKEK